MDRERASQSFFGAPGLTTKKMRIYPVEGNQNTEQTILMTGPPPTRDRGRKEDRHRPGQCQVPPRQGPDRPLRPRPGPGRITPIYLPTLRPRPRAPRNTYGTPPRTSTANPRALAPEKTFTAFTTYITNRTFDYDLEHRPTTPPHHHTTILFNSSHSNQSHHYCQGRQTGTEPPHWYTPAATLAMSSRTGDTAGGIRTDAWVMVGLWFIGAGLVPIGNPGARNRLSVSLESVTQWAWSVLLAWVVSWVAWVCARGTGRGGGWPPIPVGCE